jgi:hypothetical protein
MSSFLVGIIEQNVSRTTDDGKHSRAFDSCLYKMQKIGIDQGLSILIGWNIQPYAFNEIKDFIPAHLQDKSNTARFMIARSPEDNFSDELFNDWEYESCREGYVPGQAKVFKELESFIAQVFALNEVKSLWFRYQCMSACEVNKLATIADLEGQIYKQCSNGELFEVSDFEISLKKEEK